MSERIAVLGAGSWGTALAVHCRRAGHEVRLWGRDPALMDEIARTRENAAYLPAIRVGDGVTATASLEAALDDAPIGHPIAVLSGPSFALEVARGMPTAVVVASADPDAATRVQDSLKGPTLRLYASDDVTGVEFGGALKNIIAIAAGVVEGLAIGNNAMAALITRGLVEMSRLACAEGSRRDTLAGLSGLGDLVLTCTGDLSRNRRVGIELGRGRALRDILSQTKMVAEGVRTTAAALALGARHGVELPLAAQMSAVLDGRTTAREAVEVLMLRPQRSEMDHA